MLRQQLSNARRAIDVYEKLKQEYGSLQDSYRELQNQHEGPLHSEFDAVIEDDLFGEETWEKAESRFHYTAADTCLKKAGATPERVHGNSGKEGCEQEQAADLLYGNAVSLFYCCKYRLLSFFS